MKPKAHPVQPPRVAVWLLRLFTRAEQVESIEGDLLEEFSEIALNSGAIAARRWYWLQALKTIPHLAAGGFGAAPLSTIAVVVGGYLISAFVHGLPDKVLMTATDKYLSYWQIHFNAYVFLSTDAMLIANLLASIFVGCVVALAAKDREIIVTITLSIVLGALGGVAFSSWVARGQLWFDLLGLRIAESIAIVVGGIIVRACRPAKTPVTG